MDNTPTREELKAILDEWIPKYIRQVVELRSGGRLSAERYNELMNLLITQGDDTIELAETVKQYVEILVEETETEFELTTETVTNLANNAVSTANNAVTAINQYMTTIDSDITAFKETVRQATDTANSNATLALQTANQLVSDMNDYRDSLTQDIANTFTTIRDALNVQVDSEVATQMQGVQEALTASITDTINSLSEEVMTVANTAEQTVNSAVQDIETYKENMDVRLDAALKEVEDSLAVAGEVIQDASTIYAAINDMQDTVAGFEDRLEIVENFVENAAINDQTPTYIEISSNAELVSGETLSTAFGKIAKAVKSLIAHLADTVGHITSAERTAWNSKASGVHTHTKSQITDFPTSMTPTAHTHTKSQITDFPTSMTPTAHTHTKSQITNFPTSLPASDVYSWAKASAKPSYTWSEITSKPTSFTPASHNQAASTITAGTLAGKVLANASAAATVTNAQVRDIYAGTTDMTAGSTSLTSGTIYVFYE